MINLKASLRKRQVTFGSWITLGSTAVAEIMAKRGFDWLVVDMEHSAITLAQTQQLVRVISLCGAAALVRVGENDPMLIKRVMDTGAHGVIVPMVNSRQDALNAVAAAQYPPKGFRGVGLGRAQGYGFEFEAYKRWLISSSIVIVQIEHIDAVNDLENILGVDGVHGSIIGPYDLSGSLGVPGEFGNSRVKQAIRRYEETCADMKKAAGFHVVRPDAAAAASYRKKGYSFLAVGLDTLYLGLKCEEVLQEAKR